MIPKTRFGLFVSNSGDRSAFEMPQITINVTVFYSRSKFAAILCITHATEASLVIGLHAHVFMVLGVCNVAQILDAVVHLVLVDVVYRVFRHCAVRIKPSEAMCAVFFPVNADQPIALPVYAARNSTSRSFWPTEPPSKHASLWVVNQNLV